MKSKTRTKITLVQSAAWSPINKDTAENRQYVKSTFAKRPNFLNLIANKNMPISKNTLGEEMNKLKNQNSQPLVGDVESKGKKHTWEEIE